MTTKPRTFSPEQLAYLEAKAHYDTICEQAYAALGECTDWSDAGIEAYIEREAQVHTELGTLRASIALRDAEQALLNWGIAQVKTSKQCKPEHVQPLEKLASTPLLKYRQRAIDLILRLEV